MTSLLILIAMMIAGLLISALSIYLPAKRKQPPPTFGLCVAVVLSINVLGIALQVVTSPLKPTTLAELYTIEIGSFLAGLVVAAIVIYRLLKVRGRTFWITLGSYVIVSLVFGLGAALAVKQYVLEGFVIPTASMSPAILPQDRVLANKLTRPQRWDIVAYVTPVYENRSVWISRIVALPGETLTIDDGAVWINGQRQTSSITYSSVMPPGYTQPKIREGESVTLAADEYFVLSDNVKNAVDSRFFGPIKSNAIVGVAEFTYWPRSSWKLLR